MHRHALLVLGMHRSGTSALTGAIAKAGAHPGTNLMPATADNPEGYWEDALLVGLNDALLKSLGARWDSVAPLPDHWWTLAPALAARNDAAKLIEVEWRDAQFVVVKDPRMCRLLRFWRCAFEDAGFIVSYVVMTRRPMEVAGSLARRDQFAPEKSLALWLAHLVDAERDSRNAPRAFVTYEALLAEPAATLERVRTDAAFPLKSTPAQQQAALALVRPELNRQVSRTQDARRAGMASSLDAVLDAGYAKLRALAPHADPKDAVDTLSREAAVALGAALPPWVEHELSATQGLARGLAAEVSTTKRTISALEEEIVAARNEHHRRDEIESSLRSELANARLTASAAERAARDDLARAQRDLADQRATISALTMQIDAARVAAHDLEGQIDAARQNIDGLVHEIDEARRAHGVRDDMEAALRGERDALREESASLRTEVERLAPLAAEVERFGRDLSARERENAVLAQRGELLERQIASMGVETIALRNRLDVATAELDRLSARWFGRIARRLAQR